MFGKIKLIVATRSGVGIILEYSLSTNPNSQIHKLCVKIPFSDPVDRTFEDFARRMKAWAPRDFQHILWISKNWIGFCYLDGPLVC